VSGDHFIPVRETEIVAMCVAELPADERAAFQDFARTLAMLQHQRFYRRITALKDAWHLLRPPADGGLPVRVSAADRSAARQRLEEELTELAGAAEFVAIDHTVLDQAFRDHSLLKVRMVVDQSVISKVLLFRRGETTRTEQVRTWFGLRREPVTFTSYGMVLVYAAVKDADDLPEAVRRRLHVEPGSTIVKLFQNVPREDIEMVFPNITVQMRPIDKVLIAVPAAISGLIILVTKLFTPIALLVLLVAFWLGIRHHPVTLDQTALVSGGAAVIAVGAYLFRQFTSFQNRKINFMKTLSESLYFRNLDNDAGVFHHLLDAAEEAEVTETVLAYHLLRTADQPLTVPMLDRAVEEWLNQRCANRVDFDVAGAVAKLRDLALVHELDGRLTAVGLAEAGGLLAQSWVRLGQPDDSAVASA
jgi:hypothetical protein